MIPLASRIRDRTAPATPRANAEIAETFYGALSDKVMPGLNVVRSAAIAIVIGSHLGVALSGGLGVNAFFVLSGFLITSILLKEFAKTGGISLRTFYNRRTLRIFPVFYVTWTLSILVLIFKHEKIRVWEALSTFFYLADYGRAFVSIERQAHYFMKVSWSLAVEEQFYLLWPLALVFLLRRPDRLARRLGLFILGLWVYRAILVLGFHVPQRYTFNAFETRVDVILVGCFLAVLMSEKKAPIALLWWLRSKWLIVIPVLLLAISNRLDIHQLRNPALQLFALTLQPLVLLLLVAQLVYWGRFSLSWMRAGVVTYMANISYSLYLFHYVVLLLQPRIAAIGAGATISIAALALATASYYFLERPIMRRRDRNPSRTQPQSTNLASPVARIVATHTYQSVPASLSLERAPDSPP